MREGFFRGDVGEFEFRKIDFLHGRVISKIWNLKIQYYNFSLFFAFGFSHSFSQIYDKEFQTFLENYLVHLTKFYLEDIPQPNDYKLLCQKARIVVYPKSDSSISKWSFVMFVLSILYSHFMFFLQTVHFINWVISNWFSYTLNSKSFFDTVYNIWGYWWKIFWVWKIKVYKDCWDAENVYKLRSRIKPKPPIDLNSP